MICSESFAAIDISSALLRSYSCMLPERQSVESNAMAVNWPSEVNESGELAAQSNYPPPERKLALWS